jgi:hypothetical protein
MVIEYPASGNGVFLEAYHRLRGYRYADRWYPSLACGRYRSRPQAFLMDNFYPPGLAKTSRRLIYRNPWQNLLCRRLLGQAGRY